MKLVEYRKIAPAVAADIAAALLKHGLKMQPFGARIDERLGIVRMTIESVDVNHKAEDGTATTPEKEIYKSNCYLFDLKPEWLDQTFTMSKVAYKIVGMKKRGDKCVLVERSDNKKTYIMTPEQVRVYFLAQNKSAA